MAHETSESSMDTTQCRPSSGAAPDLRFFFSEESRNSEVRTIVVSKRWLDVAALFAAVVLASIVWCIFHIRALEAYLAEAPPSLTTAAVVARMEALAEENKVKARAKAANEARQSAPP